MMLEMKGVMTKEDYNKTEISDDSRHLPQLERQLGIIYAGLEMHSPLVAQSLQNLFLS